MLRILLFIGFLLVATIEASSYVYYPKVQQSYKFYRTPQKWFDARETCRKDNATLAMPKNEAEVSVLKNIFDGYPESILKDILNPNVILLGFHDMFNAGEYLTDEGESIQYYFHTWANNEPNNHGGSENCGSLYRSGLLNDFLCDIPALFICQKNKKEVKKLASSACISPDTAYEYSNQTNKCYKLHLNPKTWSEARSLCKAEGGNLAIIDSKTEEEFLVAMLTKSRDKVSHVKHNDYALLGFHQIFQANHFITVEGNELQSNGYTKWSPGEPNNVLEIEKCGSMHISGGLNDFPCHFSAIFFCEIESKSYPSLDVRFTT